MPPVLALAPLAGSALGSAALPWLGGLLGGSELLGGAGLFGATLGETLGGVLGGAATGALTNEDPLVGGLTGAVSGLGGPSIASGVTGAVDAGLGALGSGAAEAATAAPTSLIPAASAGSGAAGAAGAGAGTGASAGGSAAAIAAPEALAAGESGLDATLGSSLAPDLAGGAGSSTVGATLGADATALANGGAAGTASLAPSTAGGDSFSTMLEDPSWKNIGNFAAKNKDLITGGLGLGVTALQGDQPFPGEKQLRQQAKALTGQANQFMRGELTPGMRAGLRGATESAKAAARSMFAQRGMSGSSSEMEALASIDQTAAVKGAEIAQSLIQQGVNESALASNLWRVILANSLQRDNELGTAIGSFASAMAGGSGQRAAA